MKLGIGTFSILMHVLPARKPINADVQLYLSEKGEGDIFAREGSEAMFLSDADLTELNDRGVPHVKLTQQKVLLFFA